MKKRFLSLVVILQFCCICLSAQTDCNQQLNGDDALRWRNQLNFTPKYHSLEMFEYLIASLSDKAYTQLTIDMSVSCSDIQRKKNMVDNLYYFWNKTISLQKLEKNYPAYFLFYQLDKAGMGKIN